MNEKISLIIPAKNEIESLDSVLSELNGNKFIDEIIVVSDQEMKKSMKFMFEHYKLALEPACVAGISALTGPLKNRFKNQNTVVILCGSNIDMKSWLYLTENQ